MGQSSPMFTSEGPDFYQQAYAHNAPFATGGSYTTELSAKDEQQFRHWLQSTGNPGNFDPDAKTSDYDMRGYWKGVAAKGGNATDINKTDNRLHFTDKYKTPYDTTFSRESQYAKPGTPFAWQGDNLIDSRTGQVVFGLTKDK